MRALRTSLALIWLYVFGLILAGAAIATGDAPVTHTRMQEIFAYLGMGLGYSFLIGFWYLGHIFIMPARKRRTVDATYPSSDAIEQNLESKSPTTEPETNLSATTNTRPRSEQAHTCQFSRGQEVVEYVGQYSETASRYLQDRISTDASLIKVVAEAAEVCDEMARSDLLQELNYIYLKEDEKLKNIDQYQIEDTNCRIYVAHRFDQTMKKRVFTAIDREGFAIVPGFYGTKSGVLLAHLAKTLKE